MLDMRTFTLSYESYLHWTYFCLFGLIYYTYQVLRYIPCSAIIQVRPIYICAPKERISFTEQSLVTIPSLMGICVLLIVCAYRLI